MFLSGNWQCCKYDRDQSSITMDQDALNLKIIAREGKKMSIMCTVLLGPILVLYCGEKKNKYTAKSLTYVAHMN